MRILGVCFRWNKVWDFTTCLPCTQQPLAHRWSCWGRTCKYKTGCLQQKRQFVVELLVNNFCCHWHTHSVSISVTDPLSSWVWCCMVFVLLLHKARFSVSSTLRPESLRSFLRTSHQVFLGLPRDLCPLIFREQTLPINPWCSPLDMVKPSKMPPSEGNIQISNNENHWSQVYSCHNVTTFQKGHWYLYLMSDSYINTSITINKQNVERNILWSFCDTVVIFLLTISL